MSLAPLLKKLALLAGVSLFCLLVLEVSLRVLGLDAGGAWGGVPSLEDRVAAAPQKQTGQLRLLALGDSFTEYRDDARDNWVRYAEDALNRGGASVSALNLGQMGTGVRHYRKNLDDFGAALQPDVVLVGLYLGNDVLDYELDAQKSARGMKPTPVHTRGRRSSGVTAKVKRASALVRVVGGSLQRARRSEPVFDENLRHVAEVYGVDKAALAEQTGRLSAETLALARAENINPWDPAFGVVQPRRYEEMLSLSGEGSLAALEAAVSDVSSLCEAAQKLGASCLVLLVPVALQVDERYHDYFQQVGFTTSPQMANADTAMMKTLRAALTDRGVFFVDPLAQLAASGEPVYLDMDTHFSTAGQRIAGEAVAAALQSTGKVAPKK